MIVELDFQQRRALLFQLFSGKRHRFRRANAERLRHHYPFRCGNAAQLPQIFACKAAFQIPQCRIDRVTSRPRGHQVLQLLPGHPLRDGRGHFGQLLHH
ncbi:hypothetical protein D3C80_1678710 [compost metagenome]